MVTSYGYFNFRLGEAQASIHWVTIVDGRDYLCQAVR